MVNLTQKITSQHDWKKEEVEVNHLWTLPINISVRSSSTKLKLDGSTKRNAWSSLRDTSPWWATDSD